MNCFNRLWGIGLVIVLTVAGSAWAQSQYIGYVYPAGGQRGSTFTIKLGGQRLTHPSDVVVTGEGITARLVEYYPVLNNQEMGMLRQLLKELRKKETTLGDVMAAKMAWYEFPMPIGPTAPLAAVSDSKDAPSEKEVAKQNLIKRIEMVFSEDERNPAVAAQREIVFAEVTIAPDAKPGRHEIRVITKHGVSNALPFYVAQVPEVARKPVNTCRKPTLGKESQAQVKRPADQEEMRITPPCTVNGQIAAGWVDRYRFEASKGQRLVIEAKARDLIPYVADGVPGWFQAVMKLYDAKGNEVAYNDDFFFHPDPVIYYEVPADGEYVLTITDALFRGRESFTYRITVSQSPFVTSIFPLGGRVGEPVKIEAQGWNLDKAKVTAPPKDAKPGPHMIVASNGNFVSNAVPFALDTLPECMDAESNDEPAKAQKVSLPIIVNGRMDHPGDWDVFEIDAKAGQTIVAEVNARRLGSPFDSFIKITNAQGKVVALNDDHHDAASGLNTDHADSYLMAKLPADGKYHIHIGDTRRHAGKAYAYRLRISQPQPDFELRVIPSRVVIRSKSAANLTVFAIRKDGYTGPIKLNFKDLPKGLESSGATLGANAEVVKLTVKTTLTDMEGPVDLTLIGSGADGDRQIVREAVPAEDTMQAFLWRHLLPAENLPALVYNSAYQPPADRVRPPIRDEDRPKGLKRNLTKASVTRRLNEIERLYQNWLFTDDFANREIANIEARLIK